MYQLAAFRDVPLDEGLLAHLIEEHEAVTLPRLARLWRYFRNELADPDALGGSNDSPAQRVGLPSRLRDPRRPDLDDRFQREIVIENDIGWRMHTLVDFMFPKAPRILSRASDQSLRERIEAVLDEVMESNGGVALWQTTAMLGGVYGHVDLLIDCQSLLRVGTGRNRGTDEDRIGEAASNPLARDGSQGPGSLIRIEAVEAPRAIPLVNENDYRVIDAYIIHFERPRHAVEEPGAFRRLLSRSFRSRSFLPTKRATTTVTDIYSATHCQRYQDEQLVMEGRNPLGRVPVVHIQNLAQPFSYSGLSDVEPLIPLQDELNTRLSDRANRVTMQSFRMWLGKGIDGFTDRPIGPGQMWMTDNENASIEGFGGDADSPSERQHIEELREALDKASGVTPAAAGHIKAKVGNLSSENALRISLMGTIAKVKRKRITYGRGIAEACDLILHALDTAGVLRTQPRDRRVEIVWPDPLPSDESRRIQDAILKAELGVPKSLLRAELGYSDDTA